MSAKIYARVNQLTKIVEKVIIASDSYISALPDYDLWLETSSNTKGGIHYTEQDDGALVQSSDQTQAIRKNTAGIGYSYDVDKDAFIPPKLFDSWTLNDTTCLWEPPLSRPSGLVSWNEAAYQADNTQGWEQDT